MDAIIERQDTPDTSPPPIVIEPAHGWVSIRLRELWAYRELLYFLAWRDVKVRYKQTVLGASWAIIQPFFTMVVFSLFFGRLAQIPSDGIPYPIFSYTGLLPWLYFANSLNASSNSLVNSAALIRKVYFPRMVVPISSVLTGLVDFALAFIVLAGMMVFYHISPSPSSLIWLPVFLLLALATALGIGLWLSALNARYRDVRYLAGFLTQLWMFATPVVYPSSLLDEPWRTIYGLNPMVGVVEGFRWALLGRGQPPGPMLLISTLTALVLLITGMFYFRRTERTFADVV